MTRDLLKEAQVDKKYKSDEHKKRREVLRDTVELLSTQDARDRYKKLAEDNHIQWKSKSKSLPQLKHVKVLDGDWGDVTHKLSKASGNIYAVLNMANANVPGGGYLEGMGAQEENMFRRTDCHFYVHDKEMNPAKNHYTSEMSDLINGKNGRVCLDNEKPRVCIKGNEKDTNYADLSPDDYFLFYELKSAADDLRDGGTFNETSMRSKISAQLDTLKEKNIRHVVLSAFGCGAFRNPADQVARIYREELLKRVGDFDDVVFAIFNPGYGPANNLTPFKKALEGLPLNQQQLEDVNREYLPKLGNLMTAVGRMAVDYKEFKKKKHTKHEKVITELLENIHNINNDGGLYAKEKFEKIVNELNQAFSKELGKKNPRTFIETINHKDNTYHYPRLLAEALQIAIKDDPTLKFDQKDNISQVKLLEKKTVIADEKKNTSYMSKGLKKSELHMKAPSGEKTSAHAVDFGSFTSEGDDYTAWITKLNKYEGVQGAEASVFEVAFSEVASLFIKPGLTPPAQIVVDDSEGPNKGTVIGVASEHMAMQIKKQMDGDATRPCYSFDAKNWSYAPINPDVNTGLILAEREELRKDQRNPERVTADALEVRLKFKEARKAVNFLDEMPKSFFVDLMAKHEKGEVVVDMESLASILTASYALEEDDLHKGNIGFYVTDARDKQGNIIYDKEGKPKKQFVFFKIDHDLMLTDSIMSQKDMRIANIIYYKDAFKISTLDLDNFPDLKDSGNHYWPTAQRIIATGDKAYSDWAEREAFADLKNNKEFNDAKWKYFLKSAIIPVDLIGKSLTNHLDPVNDFDKIHTITNSLYFRMGELKNKLLKSEKFRKFIADNPESVLNEIKKELESYFSNVQLDEEEKKTLISQLDRNYRDIIYCFEQKLTSTKKSIVLGSYNFSSKSSPTVEDAKFAMSHYEHGGKTFELACAAIHVIEKLQTTDKAILLELIKIKKDKNDYLNPQEINSLEKFEQAAIKIRQANLPLKQQKREILALLKESSLPIEALDKLKQDLQKDEPSNPYFKFINQLRSHLWLTRKIKGTFQKTNTAKWMLAEIKEQKNKLKSQNSAETVKAPAATSSQQVQSPLEIDSTESLKQDLDAQQNKGLGIEFSKEKVPDSLDCTYWFSQDYGSDVTLKVIEKVNLNKKGFHPITIPLPSEDQERLLSLMGEENDRLNRGECYLINKPSDRELKLEELKNALKVFYKQVIKKEIDEKIDTEKSAQIVPPKASPVPQQSPAPTSSILEQITQDSLQRNPIYTYEQLQKTLEKVQEIKSEIEQMGEDANWIKLDSVIDSIIASIESQTSTARKKEINHEEEALKGKYDADLRAAETYSGQVVVASPDADSPEYTLSEQRKNEISNRYNNTQEADRIISSDEFKKLKTLRDEVKFKALEAKFKIACDQLEVAAQDSEIPGVQQAGHNLLNTITTTKAKGYIKTDDLPRITNYLNNTARLIEAPPFNNDDTSNKNYENFYNQHLHNINDAIGKNRPWGPIVGGALLCIAGILLVAAAVTVTVFTFGVSSPLTLPTAVMGGVLTAAGIAMTTGAAVGLAVTAGVGTAVAVKMGMFAHKASKGPVAVAMEEVAEAVTDKTKNMRDQLNTARKKDDDEIPPPELTTGGS